MADPPASSTAFPLYIEPSPIPIHNVALCPGCGNVGPLTGGCNMDLSSLSAACMPSTLFTPYPQSPVSHLLDKGFIDPGSTVQCGPGVGVNMHPLTDSQFNEVITTPGNHAEISNDNFNFGLSNTQGNTAFEGNAASDQQEHLASNPIVGPNMLSIQLQPRDGQHDVRTDMNKSDMNAQPILQCRWEGCTYRRHFSREADLVRHIRTIHISPGSHKCAILNCLKSFNRADNLKEHMLKVHQISHDD